MTAQEAEATPVEACRLINHGLVATLASAFPVDAYDADEVLAELACVGARIPVPLAELDALYSRRLDLLNRGRALSPPVPFARMAEAVGCTEQAASSAVNDRKRRAGKLPASSAKRKVR